jgi:hypothetical protein
MFKSLKLFSVKSLILERYITIFEKDTAIYLMYRNIVFEVYIRQRIYIIKEEKIFFIDRKENSNSLNLDLNLNTIYRLDKSNTDL